MLFETFEDALECFFEDLTVDECGVPVIAAADEWGIVADHAGGYYLAPFAEDFRDRFVLRSSEVRDYWGAGGFDPLDPADVNRLCDDILSDLA